MQSERRSIRITGRVQGVFFRASAKDEAESLGVAGFARNEADGSVLIVAEGDPMALDRFVAWCHEGPENAVVDDVAVNVEPAVGLTGFVVER
jgi:acylphosphatase